MVDADIPGYCQLFPAVRELVRNNSTSVQLLLLLLENPTDDTVELAIAFIKQVGAALEEESRAAMHEVFVRFRAILQEGNVTKKTQYLVEGIMGVRRAGFEAQGFVAVKPELDLVPEDEQRTHQVLCCPSPCAILAAA